MAVAEFLQLIGFVLVAAATLIAGFAIYVLQTGGRGVDDVILRLINDFDISPNTLAIAGIVLAWAVASLPGFLLMANGLSTEAALKQNDEAKKLAKQLEGIAATLEGIRAEARTRQ